MDLTVAVWKVFKATDTLVVYQVNIKTYKNVSWIDLIESNKLRIGNNSFNFLVVESTSVCQYNEDCPPELLCDRLNRKCISPCAINKCGDNAECLPSNHGIQCKCAPGFTGNAFLECYQGNYCFWKKICNFNDSVKGSDRI